MCKLNKYRYTIFRYPFQHLFLVTMCSCLYSSMNNLNVIFISFQRRNQLIGIRCLLIQMAKRFQFILSHYKAVARNIKMWSPSLMSLWLADTLKYWASSAFRTQRSIGSILLGRKRWINEILQVIRTSYGYGMEQVQMFSVVSIHRVSIAVLKGKMVIKYNLL